MTSPLPQLNPHEEALVLEAIEGTLAPEQHAGLEALLTRHPGLQEHMAAMRSDRSRLADLTFELPPEVDLVAPVLARLEPEVLPLRRMEIPRRRRDVRWSPAAGRRLALAAAVLLIAGFTAAYVHSQVGTPRLRPPVAVDTPDTAHPPVIVAEGPDVDAPAMESADPIAPEQLLVAAEGFWEADRALEPDLKRAVQLLSEGRLAIRVLARSEQAAREGLETMRAGIASRSKTWALAGRVNDELCRRWERDASLQPVWAVDQQADTIIEVPIPTLLEVWSADLQLDATALASLTHALSELGWRVHLEEMSRPIDMEPGSLESALWWSEPNSTWHPSGSVPVVIDALVRP
ncbi:MAG: hypothetical protein DYG94_02770 [Leptolyngbya sp. PLA3]|nr:MAG: hypothetical protein EDM82_11525 [Cyanobacteria bacterium CYA]MCE7967651.1 hypothetical protein [Leptolyngbya sp. PL-A3]